LADKLALSEWIGINNAKESTLFSIDFFVTKLEIHSFFGLSYW